MGAPDWAGIRRLATDLDDTILVHAKPCPGIEDAFDRWTGSGRDIVFITGRPLYDIKADDTNRFGETAPPPYPRVTEHARRVIAENGSVV